MTAIRIIAAIYLLGLLYNSWALIEETCVYTPFEEAQRSRKSFTLSVLKWMFWPITYIYKTFVKSKKKT